jgi:hypothetical protein
MFLSDLDKPPAKRQKFNPLGEDVHLLPDGTIKRDEDLIIACQRTWLHNAYKPDGPMYKKHMEKFYLLISKDEQGTST